MVYSVEGCSGPVTTACTSLGPIRCHFDVSAGLLTSVGKAVIFTGRLKVRRAKGIDTVIEELRMLETFTGLAVEAAPALIEGIKTPTIKESARSEVVRSR
jgi:hypothetical protein